MRLGKPDATDFSVDCIECKCQATLASLRARVVRDGGTPISINMSCTNALCSCHNRVPTDLHITLDRI